MKKTSKIKGKIHSFQSAGTLDGPGVRFVVFAQGCPLRCEYCHNPDTWKKSGGKSFTASEVAEKALQYRAFFGEHGGVTASGGEPLLQCGFVAELFSLLKEEGIHTALDTSGVGVALHKECVRAVLSQTDLVICDVKFKTEELYKTHARGSLNEVLQFLKLTESMGIPLWIRNVVVPGINDDEESVRQIVDIALSHKNLEKIELLPFKKLAQMKYEELKIKFPLEDTPECSDEAIKRLSALIPSEYR